jgi:hypothetical protein
MTPLAAIEGSALGAAMRQSLWLFPAVETVHIVAFAVLVGSIAIVDLRVLGFSRTLPVTALARHALPWTVGAFAVAVPTGLLLFTAHASDLVANRAFVLKITLIMIAGTNAAWFHLGPYRSVAAWDTAAAAPLPARACAALSLLVWVGVIVCGRMLAYV